MPLDVAKSNDGLPKQKKRRPRVYGIWSAMLTRCSNPNQKSYAFYGAKGISVCERWHSFKNFLADMGEPPTPLHTIDRIKGEKNYEPGNCRWATRTEQSRNRKSSLKISAFGKTQCLAEWAEEYGIAYECLYFRVITSGWEIERALKTPSRRREVA